MSSMVADGHRLAVGNELGFVQSPGWVYIYTADGFLEKSWQAHSWFVGGLAWSPNGTEIVTTGNARYAIWDVATQSRLWLDTNASSWGTAWIGPRMAASSLSDQMLVPRSTTCSVTNCSRNTLVCLGRTRCDLVSLCSRVASSNLAGCTNVVTREGVVLWSYNETKLGPSAL